MNLGESIYRQRTAHNLSQGDLADALDVSRQSVSKWENNMAVPDLDKLVKMSELFGITIDELVTGKMPKTTTVHTVSLPDMLSLLLFVISILCFSLLSIFALHLGFHEDVGILYGLTFLLAGIALRFHENLPLLRRIAGFWIPLFLLTLVGSWLVLPTRYLVFAAEWGLILLIWWICLRCQNRNRDRN